MLFRRVYPDIMTRIGERVILRPPCMDDFAEWSELRGLSRDFLTPWEPVWPDDDLTRGGFRRRLRRYASDFADDQTYALFVFRRDDRRLVGGVTISNVRRGIVQSGTVGYWAGKPYAGQGYMSAALRTLFPFAYDALHLHRLEAACIPGNARSIALLEACGFQYEGRARNYLCIDGRWQDHNLYARLATDGAY